MLRIFRNSPPHATFIDNLHHTGNNRFFGERWSGGHSKPVSVRMKLYVLGGCLLLGSLAVTKANQLSGQQKPDSRQSIQVEVDMVSLPVVVTTRDGRRVTNLTRDDFQVFEDGVQQTI